MRNPKIDLAFELVQLEKPDLETAEMVQEIIKEFDIDCTIEDINAIYASYLPDNFEAESKLIQHYERDFICEHSRVG